jgi:hypothetical protein
MIVYIHYNLLHTVVYLGPQAQTLQAHTLFVSLTKRMFDCLYVTLSTKA